MKFSRLLELVHDQPVFESALLLAGDVDVHDVRRQLSRWTRAGRLTELRRGLYTLAPPYRQVTPHPFLVANRLVHGSYVSAESALAWYGLIPESVPVTTSVTPSRPHRRITPLGAYQFQHMSASLLFGYDELEVAPGQLAYVVRPEKALLDLVHLRAGGDDPSSLASLRLQGLDRLAMDALNALAARTAKPKLLRAAMLIAALAETEAREYVSL